MLPEDKKQRRHRLSIIAEILQTASGGTIKTGIMYKAKLSFSQLNFYLDMLQTLNYMEASNRKVGRKEVRTIYKTTPKALQFLEDFKSIEGYLNEMYNYRREHIN